MYVLPKFVLEGPKSQSGYIQIMELELPEVITEARPTFCSL